MGRYSVITHFFSQVYIRGDTSGYMNAPSYTPKKCGRVYTSFPEHSKLNIERSVKCWLIDARDRGSGRSVTACVSSWGPESSMNYCIFYVLNIAL